MTNDDMRRQLAIMLLEPSMKTAKDNDESNHISCFTTTSTIFR